jgi:hypothetical protein
VTFENENDNQRYDDHSNRPTKVLEQHFGHLFVSAATPQKTWLVELSTFQEHRSANLANRSDNYRLPIYVLASAPPPPPAARSASLSRRFLIRLAPAELGEIGIRGLAGGGANPPR